RFIEAPTGRQRLSFRNGERKWARESKRVVRRSRRHQPVDRIGRGRSFQLLFDMRRRRGKLIRSGRLEREIAREREGTNGGMEESFDFEVKSMAMMGKWYYELWQVSFPTTVNPKGGGAAIGLKKIGNVSGSRGDRLLW
ncbi:MAG: hypothetical protein ACTS7D_01745, partial [Candidatus Hodgkinia cicadicola]